MTTSTSGLHELDRKYYLQTFKRYPLAFHHGKGSRLWDMEGNEYIDALAGIAVSSVGHAHPTLVKAIADQAAMLIHISNFYVSEPQMQLVKRLSELSKLDRVFLTNSGTESVEGAIKIARKYAHSKGRGGTIMTMQRAFHGRTLAAVAATGKQAMMQGFEPIPTGFCNIPFNDMDIIREKVNQDIGAIMLEPIQGEGGIRPAQVEYLKELRTFCDEQDIVLIFDEVQSGIGRTGKWFAHQHFGVKPDVMTLAKALGGGVPIGAVLASEKVASAIAFGDHGTTFGGNPLASAAALATLDIIDQELLLDYALKQGEIFMAKIRQAQPDYPEIKEVRGAGLMIGVELDRPAKPVVEQMLKDGVLANATADTVIRLVPPLNIPEEDLEIVFKSVLTAIKQTRSI